MAHSDQSADDGTAPAPTRLRLLVGAVIRVWALIGGVLLVAIVLLTAWSAASNLVFNAPVPGDFEIVEMGVAIAAFTFLPYCQLMGANVTADIFTMWAGRRTVAGMEMLASLVAIAFAALLLWRMSAGMSDYREYEEYTAINGIPLWVAFPPILASLALLVVASVVTLLESVRKLAAGDRGAA